MDNSGPAFPVNEVKTGQFTVSAGTHGMSLLDYFAGQAMIALLTGAVINKEYAQSIAKINPDGNEYIANAAYAHAKAMLKAKEDAHEKD